MQGISEEEMKHEVEVAAEILRLGCMKQEILFGG